MKRFALRRWKNAHNRILVRRSTTSLFLGVVIIFGTRHWNDEPISKSSVKMTSSFVPFSEYGKHTSAAVCWSASKMPGSFGKLGRRGKDACGIREHSKVCAASKSRFDLFCITHKVIRNVFQMLRLLLLSVPRSTLHPRPSRFGTSALLRSRARRPLQYNMPASSYNFAFFLNGAWNCVRT